MKTKHTTTTRRLTIKDTGFFDRRDETKKVCLLRSETFYPIKESITIRGNQYYVVDVEKNGWGETVNCHALVHPSQVSSVN